MSNFESRMMKSLNTVGSVGSKSRIYAKKTDNCKLVKSQDIAGSIPLEIR